MRITTICLGTLLSLPVLLRAQTPAPSPASITIDAAASPGPVNRLVFGTNINSADTARIFGSDKTDLDQIGTGGAFSLRLDGVDGIVSPTPRRRRRSAGRETGGWPPAPPTRTMSTFSWRSWPQPSAKQSS